MLFTKITIFLFFLSSTFASNCAKKDSSINCSIQRRCSFVEDIVWATDNKQCYLFRNRCLFENEMCSRRDEKLEEFKVVSKEECKQYCQDICTKEYLPVCGEYDNELKTFGNKCSFYGQSCRKNRSYILVNEGECNEPVPA